MTNYLTKEGLVDLQAELKKITEVEIPKVLDAINKALKEGDLKENAALDSSKLERDNLVARQNEIQEVLKDYEIIKESTGKGPKIVKIGSHVKIKYLSNNATFELFIVGSSESDATVGKISNESPLAEAIIGHKAGEEVSVNMNNSNIDIQILEILS